MFRNIHRAFTKQHFDFPVVLGVIIMSLLAINDLFAAGTGMPDYSKFKYFGFRGTQNGEFRFPSTMLLDKEQRLWIADWKNNRIQIFNREGQFEKIVHNGSAPLVIDQPVGLALSSKGTLFVTELEKCRVLEIDPATGAILQTIGRSGKKSGCFFHPRGIALDSADNIYIADGDNARIEVYTVQGQYKESFALENSAPNPGKPTLPPRTSRNRPSRPLPAPKNRPMKPRGIMVTSADNLLATFSEDGKVIHFKKDGTILWETSSSHGLMEPRYTTEDAQGFFYVSDSGKDQVFKLDPATGRVVRVIGKKGARPGTLNNPEGIAVGSGGDLYVADAGNDRCQIFKVSESMRLQLTGWKQLRAGKYAEAIKSYEQYLVYEPGNLEAIKAIKTSLLNHAHSMMEEKKYTDAEFFFQRVLIYDPGNSLIPKKIDEIFWITHRDIFEQMAYILAFVALALILVSFIQFRFFRRRRRA